MTGLVEEPPFLKPGQLILGDVFNYYKIATQEEVIIFYSGKCQVFKRGVKFEFYYQIFSRFKTRWGQMGDEKCTSIFRNQRQRNLKEAVSGL